MKYRSLISPLLAMTFVTAPVHSALATEEQPDSAAESAPASDSSNVDSPETVSNGESGSLDQSSETEGLTPNSEEAAAGEEGADSEGQEASQPEETTEVEPKVEGPERPPEPQIGGKPAKGKGMMIAGGVLLGVGAAGLATSIVLTQCKEIESTIGCENKPHRKFLVPLSASVLTLGTLLLTFGVINHVKYRRWERWTPGKQAVLAPTLLQGGAGLSYAAQF